MHHNSTHGQSKTPIWTIWLNMRQRCENPKNPAYDRYGGRGITVCERWQSFELFAADMGPRPSSKHSVERIDNHGPYAPGNCRWATDVEQGSNKRNNRLVELDGVTVTINEAARRTGIQRKTIAYRLDHGLDPFASHPRGAASHTPEQRSAAGRKGAAARWHR